MGDASDRQRILASIYLDLAEAYKDRNNDKIIKLRARVEREERHKINEESHPSYSFNKGKILSFSDKVMELNDMYDELMFELSDNSNESIREIKEYSCEDIMKFNKYVTKKIDRKVKQGNIK